MKRLLPVFFLFLGLLGRQPGASAQQLQPAPWNDPAIVWLAPAQAQTKVQDLLTQIQPQLALLTPGTAQHTDLLRRIIFYKSILRALLDEMAVPQSIDGALPEAASLGGKHEQAFTPEATLRALQNEAIVLLKA